MIRFGVAASLTWLLCLGASHAEASPIDYFGNDRPKDRVEYRVPGERTPRQKAVVYSLLGATAVSTAVGVGFHLNSDSIAKDLEAVGRHTGGTWTAAREDRRRDGERSGTVAIVGYAAAAGFLVATLTALYLTAPEDRLVAEDNPSRVPVLTPPVSLVLVSDGIIARRQWQF